MPARGTYFPLVKKFFENDPVAAAQSSGIVLTTITDVIGFFSFLGFAMVFQAYLL